MKRKAAKGNGKQKHSTIIWGGGARAEKDSIAEIAAYVSGMRRK